MRHKVTLFFANMKAFSAKILKFAMRFTLRGRHKSLYITPKDP